MSKKLSVIIVSYNVQYFLEQALRSVQKALAGIPSEIFVVDNNSSDSSVEMVASRFPEVVLLANQDNVGFSKANNQAIALATGQYILLLNPDTVVEEDTFYKCLEFMDANPEAGGLGVKMIDGTGTFLPESKRGLPTPLVAFSKIAGISRLFPSSKLFGRYHLGFLSPDEVHEVEVLSGAFMLMRHRTLEQVGLLDESFFMYGEDVDLSYRILLGGYKNYYFPYTTIIHYKGESTHKGSLNYVLVFYKAMAIFYQKHFSGSNAVVFSKLILIAIYVRAALSVLAVSVKKLFGFRLSKKDTSHKLPASRMVLVAGQEQEYKRAHAILQLAGLTQLQINRICPSQLHPEQLQKALEHRKACEIIFCGKDMAFADIISTMEQLRGTGIACSILPPQADFIVGSYSKVDRGYHYAPATAPVKMPEVVSC
ncbi:glycosyltransferase family 2 protein [Pontibacter qinzhouensis]|uniref:Glycosyltransferase family 2 protein n=1 Tax=Pontibacter qinzhouensis TaxID=2603253 RepID=A0A5C8KBB9_9BACT|nr:glycosyltransferase family 2 protein [Pontibacter qinzhouensis]TXK50482.1 glycosyltransferase family 2 protein [Pontibacter qinzhouensis]